MVKCLLCLVGGRAPEKAGMEVHACDLSNGEAETGRSFGLSALAESESSRVSESLL